MADEQRALARLARRMTELCILRARLRGRWHVSAAPRALRRDGETWDRDAYHARIAERVALDYVLGERGSGEPLDQSARGERGAPGGTPAASPLTGGAS
jgi:hypothetical protein